MRADDYGLALFLSLLIFLSGVIILGYSVWCMAKVSTPDGISTTLIVMSQLRPIIDIDPYLGFLYGDPIVSVETAILVYIARVIQSSQTSAWFLWIGIIILIIGLWASIHCVRNYLRETEAERLRMRTKLKEIKTERPRRTPPVTKEKAEKEITYIRCRYCGTKVPDTETKCPECGAKL